MIVQHENMLFVGVPLESYNPRMKTMPDGTKQFVCSIKDDDGNVGTMYINGVEGNWKLQGTITQSEISFDAEPFVEDLRLGLRDYTDKTKLLFCEKQSFRSLMQSIGAYLVNPYGDYSVAYKRHIVTGKWQQAQKTTSPKWALLTPVNN